jgi:hypothetical protein
VTKIWVVAHVRYFGRGRGCIFTKVVKTGPAGWIGWTVNRHVSGPIRHENQLADEPAKNGRTDPKLEKTDEPAGPGGTMVLFFLKRSKRQHFIYIFKKKHQTMSICFICKRNKWQTMLWYYFTLLNLLSYYYVISNLVWIINFMSNGLKF